jgi:hypothetical protein
VTRLSARMAGMFVAATLSFLQMRRAEACTGGPGDPCYPPPPANPCGPVPYTDFVCNNGYTCVVTTTSAYWSPVLPRNGGAACSDGNSGTYGDACGSSLVFGPTGWCTGTPCPSTACTTGFLPQTGNPRDVSQCQPTYLPAGSSCRNGNACVYGETCNASGTCGSGTTVTCPAATGCVNRYVCNYTPSCTMVPKNAGTSCSTGNVCTSGDTCDENGSCAPGSALVGHVCDDGDATTTGETCDAAASCKGGVSFVHLIPATLFDPEPAQMTVSAPTAVTAGTTIPVVVTVLGPGAPPQPLLTYLGTVELSSTDPNVTPVTYTFVAADKGQHTFQVRVTASQSTTIVVLDRLNSLRQSATVNVSIDSSTLQLQVSGVPSPTEAFALQSVVVSAHDQFQNMTYFGTVQFDSTDQWADLPADYAFIDTDHGTHTFASQVEFRTIGTTDLVAFDRDNGVSARQAAIVVTTAAAPACVLQPGGCCTDGDCAGVLFGSTCNVTQRACQCQTGYRQCRGGCIPSTSCCEHLDCPQPSSGGTASCDTSTCTLHCPAGTSPHNGDCMIACFAPEGDSIQ